MLDTQSASTPWGSQMPFSDSNSFSVKQTRRVKSGEKDFKVTGKSVWKDGIFLCEKNLVPVFMLFNNIEKLNK